MFGWFKKKKKKAHPNASESRNSDSGSMYDPLSPTYVSTVAVAESYDEEIVEDQTPKTRQIQILTPTAAQTRPTAVEIPVALTDIFCTMKNIFTLIGVLSFIFF